MDTVVFEFDPFTGEDASPIEDMSDTELILNAGRGPLEGKDVIHGPLVDTFLLPDGNGTVVLLDEFMQASFLLITLSTILTNPK